MPSSRGIEVPLEVMLMLYLIRSAVIKHDDHMEERALHEREQVG